MLGNARKPNAQWWKRRGRTTIGGPGGVCSRTKVGPTSELFIGRMVRPVKSIRLKTCLQAEDTGKGSLRLDTDAGKPSLDR